MIITGVTSPFENYTRRCIFYHERCSIFNVHYSINDQMQISVINYWEMLGAVIQIQFTVLSELFFTMVIYRLILYYTAPQNNYRKSFALKVILLSTFYDTLCRTKRIAGILMKYSHKSANT